MSLCLNVTEEGGVFSIETDIDGLTESDLEELFEDALELFRQSQSAALH